MAPAQQLCTGNPPTWTTNLISCLTIHWPIYKLAIVKTLYSRTDAVCSNVTAKNQETWHIRQALIINGYHITQQHKLSPNQQTTRIGVWLYPLL